MIKWNAVTWYSRIASIIFFVGVMPVVNFFIGVQYEQTQAALARAQAAEDPLTITTQHVKNPKATTTSEASEAQ